MNTKNLITGVVAGIIVFAWGMISWMALPFHGNSLSKLNAEPIAVAALQKAAPQAGVYYFPAMDAPKDQKMKPPRFLVVPSYKEKSMPMCMATGLLIQILAGLVISCLVCKSNQDKFSGRMKLIMKAAIFAGIVGHLPNWLYWGFTPGYTALAFVDLLIGWGLAGVWIAKRV